MNDHPPVLTPDEFDSLREVNKGDAQREIPQLHWECVAAPNFDPFRLPTLTPRAAANSGMVLCTQGATGGVSLGRRLGSKAKPINIQCLLIDENAVSQSRQRTARGALLCNC
jgi:hypothetical protein